MFRVPEEKQDKWWDECESERSNRALMFESCRSLAKHLIPESDPVVQKPQQLAIMLFSPVPAPQRGAGDAEFAPLLFSLTPVGLPRHLELVQPELSPASAHNAGASHHQEACIQTTRPRIMLCPLPS